MREDYDFEFWEKYAVARPKSPLKLVDEFEDLIDSAPPELDVQYFLEENPWLLSVHFPHCHYILPRFSLGGQYIPDFIAPERCSGDTMWMLIELERPDAKLITKKGEFADTVRTALGQVRDWKRWLHDNQELARKSRLEGGLGLDDMSKLLCGFVVVGRRSQVTKRYNQLRTDLLNNEAIQILTYDRLIDWARNRAEFWEKSYS